jgi:hypothetical protein
MRMGRSLTLACAAAIAAMTLSTTAHADTAGRATLDWDRLIVGLDRFARTGDRAEKPNVSVPALHPTESATNERTQQLYVQNAGNAWFGVAPRVSLVARDWGSAYKLAGDQLSLADSMRLSASTRMVMSRVRFGDFGSTLVTPFAQLGFGQWRTDTKVLPLTPSSMEVAAQVGGGVEIHVSRSWQIACETSATTFIRDAREEGNLPQTRLWSTMLASRLEW